MAAVSGGCIEEESPSLARDRSAAAAMPAAVGRREKLGTPRAKMINEQQVESARSHTRHRRAKDRWSGKDDRATRVTVPRCRFREQ